jgi:hypothetical protein
MTDQQNPVTPTREQILREAASYLEQHGWLQHGPYDLETGIGGLPAADVTGAIRYVALGIPVVDLSAPVDIVARLDGSQPLRRFAEELVELVVLSDAEEAFLNWLLAHYVDDCDCDGNYRCNHQMPTSITDWNTSRCQSGEQAVTALRRAADHIQRHGDPEVAVFYDPEYADEFRDWWPEEALADSDDL